MSKSYLLVLSDGTYDQTIAENAAVVDHGLTFVGRGVTEYGEERNNNILHMAENFAHPDFGGGNPDPSIIENPLAGQLWYDTTSETLNVYTGSLWEAVADDSFVTSGTYSVNDITGEVILPKTPSGSVTIDNAASETNLNNHIAVDNPAHAASAISFANIGSLGATNVQDAIEGNSAVSNLGFVGNTTNHVNSTTAHSAANISVSLPTPAGIITTNNVQGAIEDLDDELDDINTDITTVNNDLAAHIADAVDAHDASAISFIPVGGLTSVNVQDAIDEIFATAGSPGALETVRVRPSATQAIGSSFTQLLFQIVDYGNVSGQWNTGTSTYTAGFDQEVNVTLSAAFTMANNRTGQMEIRIGGTSVRNHTIDNRDNDDGDSDVSISRTNEITAKLRLTTGQQVRFYMYITPASGSHQTSALNEATAAEFEIVRIL